MNHISSSSAPAIRFIEFMGLPGSGKSTIAAHLESDLRRCGIKTVSRSLELADDSPFMWRQCKRLLRVVRNAGRCRRLYLDALRLIKASGQRSRFDLAKVTWNFWSVTALMADCRAAANSIAIVDQGLFQAIWSIQFSSSKELSLDAWNELLRAAGIADLLLVNIRAEIPVAGNRLFGRAHQRTRLGPQALDIHTDSWRTAAANFASLTDLAQAILPQDQSGHRVITIESNSAGPKAAAAEIARSFLARKQAIKDPVPRVLYNDI